MSVSGAQYDKFVGQAVIEGRVFTFAEQGGLLEYPMKGGTVIAFWSSRTRLVAIQKRHPKYRKWEIRELSFSEIWHQLGRMERRKIAVGVNWSGATLTGYDVPVSRLRASLSFYLDKYAKRHLLEAAI